MNGIDGSPAALNFGRYLTGAGAVVAVLFTVLEPSPSAGLALPARLAFWLLHAYGGLGGLVLVQNRLDRFGALRRRPWLAVTLAGLAGSLLIAPLGLSLESLFGQEEDFDGKGLEGLARFGLAGEILSEASEMVPAVTATWLVLQLPWLLRLNFRSAPPLQPDTSAEVRSEPESGFFAALPEALGRDIAALTSELHYLRVRAPRGNALVLYNLKDAVAELEGRLPGLQVHRSHWVARDHVRRLVRRGSGWACQLSTGDLVPVSRRRARQALEAFGDAAHYRTDPP